MEGLHGAFRVATTIGDLGKGRDGAKQLPKGSWPILRMAVLDGEFARGRGADITGYATRQARTVLNDLINQGYLISETTRSPVRLGFPASVVDRWFCPGFMGEGGDRDASPCMLFNAQGLVTPKLNSREPTVQSAEVEEEAPKLKPLNFAGRSRDVLCARAGPRAPRRPAPAQRTDQGAAGCAQAETLTFTAHQCGIAKECPARSAST